MLAKTDPIKRLKATLRLSTATGQLPSRAELKATSVDSKIAALKLDRAALWARIVELEKAHIPQEPPSLVSDRVRELLGENAVKPADGDGELHPARLELEAMDKALAELAARQEAEQLENLSAAFAQSRDVWTDINVATARALVELRDLNQRRAEFLATFVGAHAFTADPLAKMPLDAIFKAGAPAKTFLELAVRVGLVTKKEIEQ